MHNIYANDFDRKISRKRYCMKLFSEISNFVGVKENYESVINDKIQTCEFLLKRSCQNGIFKRKLNVEMFHLNTPVHYFFFFGMSAMKFTDFLGVTTVIFQTVNKLKL